MSALIAMAKFAIQICIHFLNGRTDRDMLRPDTPSTSKMTDLEVDAAILGAEQFPWPT
jgi:hypothetical protein